MTTAHEPLMARVRSALTGERGRGVIVAVSGGGDSVGLLRMMGDVQEDLDLRLSVAHLDHGTRGEVGREDAAFVADLAGSMGLAFDLGRWAPTREGHFEADARKARYDWLVAIAKKREAALVAVGHTQDDQAETILHRILRGTGLRGLAGIPARRSLAEGVTLIRPLLDVSREEIRGYLAGVGQSFRDDATNADVRRTRNRIRHDLLPRLAAEYNPNVAEALVRLGRLGGEIRAWERHIEHQVEAAVVTVGELAVVLRCEPLRSLPPAARAEVLRRAWRRAGWPERSMTAGRWLRLAATVDRPSARFSLGGRIEVRMSGGLLRLSPSVSGHPEPRADLALTIPGAADWGGIRLVASLESPAPEGEIIDLDRLDPALAADGRPALTIRAPRDGDRFDPLGLDGHTQALNDFFRGRAVARERRRDVPLVCDNAGIVWVVGHRIAHRVRVTGETRRRIVLNAVRSSQ
ncbi:MAG: putative ATPase of the PP-loop superfamily implicated in cell cycle control [Planctomycetota bacterium]|nr:putative ATPase of the PP-loop superfamily implicated in cell cycle control [Planctomycetota bacterium]